MAAVVVGAIIIILMEEAIEWGSRSVYSTTVETKGFVDGVLEWCPPVITQL